jgi:hypothetical protein
LHLRSHPLLIELDNASDEVSKDPCVNFMTEGTDEAKKVKRNEGKVWYAIFKKRQIIDERALDEEVI